MKKAVLIIVLMLCVALAAGTALAVPAGKTIEFAGGAMGKVTFSGQTHADAGNKCNDCHPSIFQMKKGSTKIAAPHKADEFCGTCHKEGGKAFAQEGNCAKCHVK